MWDERWFNIEPHKSRKLKCLNDLRTAIAKHDSPEFKVGDLVVRKFGHNVIFEVSGGLIGGSFCKARKIDGVIYTDYVSTTKGMPHRKCDLRHATSEEKEAGHRIDDTTDHVTDIRNHVSPSTLVWDLASGEDWTAEAERHG